MAHFLLDSTDRVIWSYLIFVCFWTDIFASIGVLPVGAIWAGRGAADAVVIKRSA